MGNKEDMERYLNQLGKFQDNVVRMRSSARSRLVWFVAIAGFVILYGKNLWDPIAGHCFKGIHLAILIIPWIIASIFAVITHILIDEVWLRENKYYVHKIAEGFIYIGHLKDSNDINISEFEKIIKDENEDTSKRKKQMDDMHNIVNCFERFTFVLYGFSILWTFVGPFTSQV